MASPLLRPKADRFVDQRSSTESAALRLLSAERPEEILPILLEEIVFLGFPRALVLEVEFETGEMRSTASLNCERSLVQKFRTSLWASENPVVSALQNLKPVLLPRNFLKDAQFYAVPMLYRSRTRCWEAERERRNDCLAVLTSQSGRRLQMQEQTCGACGMRAYVSLVVAQVPKNVNDSQLRQLRHLVDRGNRYLSRLFKV